MSKKVIILLWQCDYEYGEMFFDTRERLLDHLNERKYGRFEVYEGVKLDVVAAETVTKWEIKS